MVGKMRRYWLLVLMVLGIALTLVISQLVPFPNEHIPIGSTTFFPALFVVHLTGLTLIFLLTALSLESLRRLFSRWMEERIVLQLIILVLVLSIPAFICELVSLGSLQETDSFQGTYVTYRLVKVEETKGLDDDFDLTKINHF